jgi:hypothetical protein
MLTFVRFFLVIFFFLFCSIQILSIRSGSAGIVGAWLGLTGGSAVQSIRLLSWPQSRLPVNSLCVLSIFKNESINIREWASHYRWQGASALLLLNDSPRSNDEPLWQRELRGFEDFVTVLDAPFRHAQERNYNEAGRAWLEARGCTFVAVLDLDEFMFVRATSTMGNGSARDLRSEVQSAFETNKAVAELSCPWLMFGSSGLNAHPRGLVASVRLNFTWRALHPHSLTKSIIRLARLVRFRVHNHEVQGITYGCPPALALNHYPIQSREYFEAVKMTRGDVAAPELDKIRDLNYFRSYDGHDVEDTTLRDLVLRELI